FWRLQGPRSAAWNVRKARQGKEKPPPKGRWWGKWREWSGLELVTIPAPLPALFHAIDEIARRLAGRRSLVLIASADTSLPRGHKKRGHGEHRHESDDPEPRHGGHGAGEQKNEPAQESQHGQDRDA